MLRKQKKDRNLSLDILRICCMCMIITLHLFSYSNIDNFIPRYSTMFWVKSILSSVSSVCVNCFVLISGYFAVKTPFKFSKLFMLIREVLTYSIVIYLVFLVFGLVNFDVKSFILAFLPSLTRQYWFITTYLGLYIISPFIKIAAEKFKKEEFFSLLLIIFLLFVVYYNLFFFSDNLNFGGSTGLPWFIYLYLCGIYLSKFVKRNCLSQNLRNYFIILLLNLGSRVPFYMLNIITGKEVFFIGATIFGSVYNSIFVFLQSIAFFKIFADCNIKFSRNIKNMVLFLSTTSLATYLIHDNNFVRGVLWAKLDFSYISNSIELIITWAVIIIVIYGVSSIIEYLRQILDRKIWRITFVSKIDFILENKVNILLDKIERL